MVNGDATRLEEVLINLLSNAVRYSPGGTMIQVTVAQEGDNAILEVTDEGIGIPRIALTQLFQPFFRASNVGRMPSGFGLGLYIVQEIVTRHNGRVEVISVEGEGSTFRVILPRAGEG